VVSFGLPSPRAGRWVRAGIAKLHQWGGSEGRRALNRHAALPRDTRGHLREERDQVPSAPETFFLRHRAALALAKELGAAFGISWALNTRGLRRSSYRCAAGPRRPLSYGTCGLTNPRLATPPALATLVVARVRVAASPFRTTAARRAAAGTGPVKRLQPSTWSALRRSCELS
jgi:hypothetical protein